MRKLVATSAKLLIAYLLAGAILVMYLRWPNFEGHANVPFSGFPAVLIWSPIAPALIASEYSERRVDGVISFLVFGVSFCLIAWLFLRRR
jgi:hypothetical protein